MTTRPRRSSVQFQAWRRYVDACGQCGFSEFLRLVWPEYKRDYEKPRAGDAAKRQAAAIKASYKAAMVLDRVGMDVVLTEDSGQETVTKLTSLPWTLGHGAWVVKVEGKSGGYDCARIRPLANVSRKGGA